MSLRRIEEKLKQLKPKNSIEQELMLSEILQQYVLVALAKKSFFKVAAFHGGTCLRLLYGLDRFSEDLDFSLKESEIQFSLTPFLLSVKELLSLDDIDVEILDKDNLDSTVKKAFLKTDSIGKQLIAHLPFSRHKGQKVKLKLEIDTNPPVGGIYEPKFLDFPTPVSITAHTLESSFAGKCHALLCRSYVKGRDWYDLVWYVEREIVPNLQLLSNAMAQVGPWQGKELHLGIDYFLDMFHNKIKEVDWSVAKRDVARFLKQEDLVGIEVWGVEYFEHLLEKMRKYF